MILELKGSLWGLQVLGCRQG